MDWKNTKEITPENGTEVLIYVGGFHIAKYNSSNKTFETRIKNQKQDFWVEENHPRYWMPLQPPV